MTDQLYIRSTIGESLMEALDSLIEANKITPELAHRVAQEFDASILRSLEKKVTAKSSFKGQLDTYRYCDNASWGRVWDFVIKNVTFRLSPTQSSSKKDDLEVSADRVRLVLVDSKVVTAANPQQG